MKKLKYIVANIISILIEYSLLFLALRIIFKMETKLILLILGIIFIVLVILDIVIINVTIAVRNKRSLKEINYKNLQEIIDIINAKYHKNISLVYVNMKRQSPAWSLIDNKIYININSINCYVDGDNGLLPGLVAYCAGNIVVGVGNLVSIANFKLSTIIGEALNSLLFKIYDHYMKGFKKVFFNILLGIDYLFSLNNLIFVYPLLRQDSYDANKFAVELGYGKELRAYYGCNLAYHDSYVEKLEFLNPSNSKMIAAMNDQMNLNENERMIYSVNNVLYYADINAEAYELNDITAIDRYAINSTNNNLVKLELNKITSLEYKMIGFGTNLHTLIAHNLKHFDCDILIIWKQLEELVVDDEKIYEEILNYSKTEDVNEKLLNYITNRLTSMKNTDNNKENKLN
jgi:hypothetical protein